MPFGQLEVQKEMLRKMLWQVADFSGVEVLTYCSVIRPKGTR